MLTAFRNPPLNGILIVLALLVTGLFGVVDFLLANQFTGIITEQTKMVNLSSSQSFLAQQALRYAHELREVRLEREHAVLRIEMLDALTKIETALNYLISLPLSPALNARYFAPPTNTDRQVRAFIAEGRAFATLDNFENAVAEKMMDDLERLADDSFVNNLNMLAREYEFEAVDKTRQFRQVDNLLNLTLFFTVVSEALFVFRPMMIRINRERNQQAREIIERTRVQNDLARSQRQVRALLDHSPAAIFIKDRYGRLILANPAFSRMVDTKRASPLGGDIADIGAPPAHPISAEGLDPDELNLMKERHSETQEARYQTQDGPRNYTVSKFPLLDADGSAYALCTMMIDVTQRVQAESALQLSEERYKFLIDHVSDIVTVSSVEGTIQYISPSVERVLGYTPAECLKRTFWDLIDADDQQVISEFKNATISKRGRLEFRMVRRDGDCLWFESAFQVIFDLPSQEIQIVSVSRNIHERKLAETILRGSQERLRFLLTAAPVVIFSRRVTDDLGLNFVSDNVQALFGYRPEQFTADAGFWISKIHPDDAPRVAASTAQHVESITSAEFRYLCADGHYKWIRMEMRLVTNNAGTPLESVGYWLDISDRKLAETELQKANNQLRAIMDNTSVLIYIKDLDSRYMLVNRAFSNLFGVIPEEIIGRTAEMLFPKETADRLRQLEHAVIETSTPNQGELDVLLADGLHHFIDAKFALKTPAGVTYAVCGVATDVTDVRRAQEALRESERLTERITNTVPDILYIFDIVEFRLIYVNQEYIASLDLSLKELEAGGPHFLKSLIHPEDLGQLFQLARLYDRVEDKEIVNVELRVRHRDGLWRWYSSRHVVYQRNPDGSAKQVLGIAEDITERKSARERQIELMAELEAANQNLKDFAYIISHDLKAPLRAIRSLTNWFITDYGDQLGLDAKELLDLLANRVMRMDALINGVLQYSRIGRINEHKVEVDLNFVIREVIDLLAPNAKNVRFEVAPNLPTLYVEPTRIEQVFQNLIGNAIKFMDKAQGVVKIGFNDEGDYWRFSVADNGPGIEPQFWSSIFQIFQTITPRDVAESTGIGLTIVKRIVELYGGKVWVESEVGQGSTFYLTFPKPSKK